MHGLYGYLGKRILLAGLTLLIILFVSYLLLRIAPGDPTRSSMFGSQGDGGGLSSEKSALVRNDALREKLHLDKPAPVGFYLWMKQILLHGDFGTSAAVDKGRPVAELESMHTGYKDCFLFSLIRGQANLGDDVIVRYYKVVKVEDLEAEKKAEKEDVNTEKPKKPKRISHR